MASNSLQELFVEQLQDLYDAEQQIIKALPKMIDATDSEELRSALTEHLEVTKAQAERIEKICEELDEEPEGDKCKGMAGVIQEGSDHMKQVKDPDVRDAVIIAGAQRVEHYEIAGYGTARTFANLLGYEEAANMLQETLDEEKEADSTLTSIAEKINVEAADEDAGDEVEDGEERETEATSGQKAKSASSRSKGKSGRGKRAA